MMHSVKMDCAHIAYHKNGRGPKLVLVHGTGGDAETNFAALNERFEDDFTVIRPDYSGSGGTQDDGRPLSIAYLAGQVVAAARDGGDEQFHLVGFSLGAAVAAYIAAEYPSLVRSLVLISGFSSTKDARLKLQFETWQYLIEHDRRTLARLILLTGFTPQAVSDLGAEGVDDAVETTLAATNWEGLARQVELDLRVEIGDLLGSIAAPTICISGTFDHMVAPKHSREMQERIPKAEYVELPVGHLSVMEAPDIVAAPIRRFLRAQSIGQ